MYDDSADWNTLRNGFDNCIYKINNATDYMLYTCYLYIQSDSYIDIINTRLYENFETSEYEKV